MALHIKLLPFAVCCILAEFSLADKPCAPRRFHKDASVVCVCNEDYCDELERQEPEDGSFVAYTSSKDGLRFYKHQAELEFGGSWSDCNTTLVLDPKKQYQTMHGFGGAVTDSAAMNWKSLSESLQQSLINSYFGSNGIEFNMVRLPIGGTDFSVRKYSLNDLPENDYHLSNFSLAHEDYEYKIPMIKAIQKVVTAPLQVVGTVWSPPVWMKTNHRFNGQSYLLHEHYQTFALYHYKFIDSYEIQGIPIWAVTTSNEPLTDFSPMIKFNTLGWTSTMMGEFVSNNLGPTIRASQYKYVKILAVDDQRVSIPIYLNMAILSSPTMMDYVDGVAVHFYADDISPPELLDQVKKLSPDMFILYTEACEGAGANTDHPKVSLGSWDRARHHLVDILDVINHDVTGWIDWNLVLDQFGGPNWAGNYVDAPVIAFPHHGEFLKQPMFYAMGHLSKFVPRGSVRIDVKDISSDKSSVHKAAFLTPEGTVVVVLYNDGDATSVGIRMGNSQASIGMVPHSVSTLEFLCDGTHIEEDYAFYL